MSSAGVRVGVGTRFRYDGETVEVIEMAITATGNEVVLKDHHGRVMRLAVKELLSDRAQVIPDGPGPSRDDDEDLASVVLAQLSHGQRDALLERAAPIREVLTGYRSGSPRWRRKESRDRSMRLTGHSTNVTPIRRPNWASLVAPSSAGCRASSDAARRGWSAAISSPIGKARRSMTGGWKLRWR